MKHSHAQWGSKLVFLLAATGSAVGLGNIWKFPYMTGVSGGSAFVLTYLICIALIGFPLLVAEWLIGRRGKKNPIYTMETVAIDNQRSKSWRWVGAIGILGSFLILSFYSVIGGWSLDYIFIVGNNTFSGMDGNATNKVFSDFLANPQKLLIWHTVFMLLTVVIVAMGVSKGLERGSKIMMPALAIVMLILMCYGIFATGAFKQTLVFLFSPNWSLINGEVILAALGHAFFTLSLGLGTMMSYGSYLGEDIDLLKTARTVVILDTVLALAAGMTIFPLVFANHLEPSSGPGLLFVTLPIAFGNMTGGSILGVLFFILLSFAAITSSMSLLEPTVELLEEKTALGRKGSAIVSGFLVWLLGVASLLSFNLLSDFLILGKNVFDLLDMFTSKLTLPLTGLATIIFFGWFMNQQSILDELKLNGTKACLWKAVCRYITPIGVMIVIITSLFL